ncbi:iron-sulfur cluster assembly accessory protein [Roseococcus sp. SYP-B2431]|uniref:HesB/IscA family protein n=1 Tax=Roseococcus sp. SYP-B2431 TaxID=2496640 RepID=UPI001038944F|nr:iron-sulfur cluster assembly accessory protein [Roseococcus sp. SYP-B2431]TCH99564.1 iron-sulfur cluster assembly accessory protein [Roseococcus sp. SYP-B2431]
MPDGNQIRAFHVTPRAAEEIAAIAGRQGRAGAGLRVSVSAGGCSGLQYGFDLEDKPSEDDLVVAVEGIRVFVDGVSLDFLAGSELDWHDALIGSHFVVRNPQATSGCGCGVSFAV